MDSEASGACLPTLGGREVLAGDLADPAFTILHPAELAMGFVNIDAVWEAGVGHFVFSSVLHANTVDLVQHEIKRIEEHLLSSGLEFTIFQSSNYMLAQRLKPLFDEGVFPCPGL